ncbi:LacI family DNA-binding transcriptional regulator [Arthrobacter sp. D2-10]
MTTQNIPRPTIGNVAQLAGVSRAAVSYVLNGRPGISSETRQRVEAAIKELDFTPNAGARALATARTGVIGLLVEFEADEFTPAMMSYVLAVTEAARRAGLRTLLITEHDAPSAIDKISRSRMVDGYVLLDVLSEDPRVAALKGARQPGVLVGVPRYSDGLDVIDLDFEAAARLAVDSLADAGHAEVILVTPPSHVFERGAGYSWRFRDTAIAHADYRGIKLVTHSGAAAQPEAAHRLNSALDRFPDATALLIHSDACAAAVHTVINQRATRIPDDLSVLSLHSESFERMFSPGVSYIDTVPETIGQLAVDRLVARVADENSLSPIIHLHAPLLVDRGSIGRA